MKFHRELLLDLFQVDMAQESNIMPESVIAAHPIQIAALTTGICNYTLFHAFSMEIHHKKYNILKERIEIDLAMYFYAFWTLYTILWSSVLHMLFFFLGNYLNPLAVYLWRLQIWFEFWRIKKLGMHNAYTCIFNLRFFVSSLLFFCFFSHPTFLFCFQFVRYLASGFLCIFSNFCIKSNTCIVSKIDVVDDVYKVII